MRALTVASIVLGGAAALAACTANSPFGQPYSAAGAYGEGRQCFYAGNVSGFRQGPNDTIIVNTNSRDYYELQTLSYCAQRLDFEHRIALRSRSGSFVCTGYDAEIYVPDALGATYCPVRAVRKLTPGEVAALRARR
jgi:hypothetical protein